jgi:hypothetical protein
MGDFPLLLVIDLPFIFIPSQKNRFTRSEGFAVDLINLAG